jgi:ATP-dependent Clp protease adapter protein ClpS
MSRRFFDSGENLALSAVALLALAGIARRGSLLRRVGDDGKAYGLGTDFDVALLEEAEPETPKECEVWLLNADDVDGYFVSKMLRHAFGITEAESMRLGLTAHRQGRALVRVLSCTEANAKVAMARDLAQAEHPTAVRILDVVEVDEG